MKPIITKEKKEKTERIKQVIIGVALIIIMFFSIAAYSFQKEDRGSNTKVEYNGFEFVKQNDLWILNTNGINLAFKYNPNEIEEIGGSLNLLDSYSNQPLYISSENIETIQEIYQNMNLFVLRIREACLDEKECKDNLPVKTCEDNFIIIKKAELSKIYQQDNCVFIEGKKEDLIKLSDEFMFKILGIRA